VFPFRFRKRYREIVFALIRHGFGWLVATIGLAGIVPFHRGFLGHPRREERFSGPEHLRMAFEELGPTFIKLAQILSTRPDLISPAYAEEFSRLQDRVPAKTFDVMRPVLESELGAPYTKIFAAFDPEPIASASIGQAYRARLPDGTEVVVKIQKPGVRDVISQDLEILRDIVHRVSRRTELAKKYDLKGLLEEFGFFLINELNYIREGQNADRFRHMFRGDPRIFIPQIYWDYTSSRVLVMDELHGIKANELDQCESCIQPDRHQLAITAVHATFKEIFEYGFFHADPHPGNFVIMEGEVLGLMDFGLVGYLDEKGRESFLRFMYEMVRGDTESMLDALWDLGLPAKHAHRPALKRDLNHLFFRFAESSLGDIVAGDMLRQFTAIAYRHQLYFPPDLALLLKVLMMSEGLGAMLDPQFKLFELAEPYLANQYRRLLSPPNVIRKMGRDASQLFHLGSGLPQRASRLLQRVEAGDIQVTIHHAGLETSIEKIQTAIDRLTISMLLSLLVIATGIYILAGHSMGFNHYLVNILLFMILLTGLAGFRILLNLWRQRKK
jgi:ubiquinone biosynthesis protein